MKLYIDQLPGDGVSGRSFVIYNEAGERLACITKASVHHDRNEPARLDISLVVDGSNIVFGKPPSVDEGRGVLNIDRSPPPPPDDTGYGRR